MKHKIGDKVRIIAHTHNHHFKIGDIVTIISVSIKDNTYDAKLDSQSWYIFENDCDTYHSYKTLKCINNSGCQNIIQNKIYNIVASNDNKYQVIDDSGDKAWYSSYRFEEIENKEPISYEIY